MEPYAGFEPQVGEIRALRTFRVGSGGVLYPLFSNTAWVDGANQAYCRLRPTGPSAHTHAAPSPGCTCGFYAYGSEQATGEYPHARHVLAVVACWGHIIAGTRGIRAENARIEALWFSDAVPAELAAQVAERYPSARLVADKPDLIATHPPTELDCYEPQSPRSALGARWLPAVAVGAVALTALPGHWWQAVGVTRPVWGAAVAVLMIAALVMGRGGATDLAARRRRVFLGAAALWVAAPLAGPAGTILLRMPLIQLAVLLFLHRRRLHRAARQFPAVIDP